MRQLLCRILTKGRHYFRLKEYRYRCVFCRALRYQVQPKPVKGLPLDEPIPYEIKKPGQNLILTQEEGIIRNGEPVDGISG
jgi:hypothetical protein